MRLAVNIDEIVIEGVRLKSTQLLELRMCLERELGHMEIANTVSNTALIQVQAPASTNASPAELAVSLAKIVQTSVGQSGNAP